MILTGGKSMLADRATMRQLDGLAAEYRDGFKRLAIMASLVPAMIWHGVEQGVADANSRKLKPRTLPSPAPARTRDRHARCSLQG